VDEEVEVEVEESDKSICGDPSTHSSASDKNRTQISVNVVSTSALGFVIKTEPTGEIVVPIVSKSSTLAKLECDI